MSELYEIIQGLCEEREITIARMCKEIQIPSSIVYELKSQRRDSISTKTALKIADYFGVSISYLFPSSSAIRNDTGAIGKEQKKDSPMIMDGKTFELVSLLDSLTSPNYDRAMNYIQYLISTQSQ